MDQQRGFLVVAIAVLAGILGYCAYEAQVYSGPAATPRALPTPKEL